MSKNTNNGIGLNALLTIALITLKLTSVINWSWWWVLSPMWLPFVIVPVLLVIAYLYSLRP